MKGPRMFILHDILEKLKKQFPDSDNGRERGIWFAYTIIAIILPITSSKTSNIVRSLKTIFGFTDFRKKRFYTFIASPKIAWKCLWHTLWKMIPDPLTQDRLLLVIDDYINPKTGKKIFACNTNFDHAAKSNQSKYPWAQNIVVVGLLKIVKGRWACLPLNWRFYHPKNSVEKINGNGTGAKISFKTKLEQAADMIIDIAQAFGHDRILAITDSWFGNRGLFKPLKDELGSRVDIISRLRSNNNVFQLPGLDCKKGAGRPRKYDKKLGAVCFLAAQFRTLADEYAVNLYGRVRSVVAYERVVMLKTLRCPVKVVWIYRKTQWVALFSTDLSLSVRQIIEFYGARWKIEAAFKELKQDIGSAETQNRHPNAVENHLHFCMMATSVTWIYACRIEKTPERRHAVKGRNHFAFSDVRRAIAKVVLADNFGILSPLPSKSLVNTIVAALLRLVA